MAATPTPQTVTRGGERRLLLLAVVCAALLVVAYAVMVRTSLGQEIDDTALEGRTTRASVIHATDDLLNTISVTSLAVAGVAIMAIAVARRRLHLAVVAVVAVGGANLVTQLLKRSLPRPDLFAGPESLGGPSFPSGHATVAMSLAVALVLVVPARWRAATAVLGFGYAVLVGTGTVTAGWHRPSDVVGAYLVAIGSGALGAMAVIIWRGATPSRRTQSMAALVSPIVVVIGIALLAAAFVGFGILIVAQRQGRLDAVQLDEAYAGALLAIIGAGTLLVAAFVRALRNVTLDPRRAQDV